MIARFTSEDNIVITPESEEERILFNRFVKLITSKQKRLVESPTYAVGTNTTGRYTALGLSLLDMTVDTNRSKTD